MTDLLTSAGYVEDREFNLLHGDKRLFLWDSVNDRQLDVFIDRVDLCHTIELRDRLGLPGPSLALADLLLMKLQVVETNNKDIVDILTLLSDHEFTSDDTATNLSYLVELTAADWGLWKTTRMVMERVATFLDLHALPQGVARSARARIEQFLDATAASEKTRGWKLRAKIGERKRWYELPEEPA